MIVEHHTWLYTLNRSKLVIYTKEKLKSNTSKQKGDSTTQLM